VREVDEALREQEMVDAVRRYGIPAGILIVLLLVGLAGYLWWQHEQKAAAGERGEQLTMALDHVEAGQLDLAAKQLAALSADGKDATKAAAQLLQAGILAEQNKGAEAATLFQAVAADASAPQPYRDLATVRDVATRFDKLSTDDIATRLKPMAVPGNPWFGSAGELLGIAYVRQGRGDLAGPLFAAIAKDKTVPVTLQRRARQMAGLLGVDSIDDVNQAAQSAPGAPAPGQPADQAAPAPAQAEAPGGAPAAPAAQ